MTVWSHSTASGDPTSPSSPTLPVGRPNHHHHHHPPHPPRAADSAPPRPTAPSKDRGHSPVLPRIVCRRRWWMQHLQSASCVFQEGGNGETKAACGCSVRPFLKTDHGDTTLHLLVVLLYTEQASIHHDERGHVVTLCIN